MKRTIKNTVAVLVITVMTTLALFSVVSLTGRVVGSGYAQSATGAAYATSDYAAATSSSSGGTLTCPATGCTATSCHATGGGRP